jgi:hypothetical protein
MILLKERCRGGMTRVNPLSTLAGNVAHSKEGKVQSTVAEHQMRKEIFLRRLLMA